MWSLLEPHFLPANHPIKNNLDNIFQKKHVTSSMKEFEAAGFHALERWRWDKVVVARHPKLMGYLVKAYLDDHVNFNEKIFFWLRITGAQAIRDTIHSFGYQSHFKVPKKWIYPLPSHLTTSQSKHFILVVEDMDLVSNKINKKIWHDEISRERLVAISHMLESLGLADAIHIKNLPFTKDKRNAFIDTEHHHLWPVRLDKISLHLNPEMQRFWIQITEHSTLYNF